MLDIPAPPIYGFFKSLNDDDLEQKCMTPGGVELRISKWLRSMVEHEVHHRGQISRMRSNQVTNSVIFGFSTRPLSLSR